MRRLILPLLATALAVPAAGADGPTPEGPTPRDVFEQAVRVQGALRQEDLRDITLEFRGHIHEEGTHTVRRTYWYRARDRSFRIRTQSGADASRRSERGVLKAKGCWERVNDRILELSTHNRDDFKAIQAIRKERTDFERILRMVLLSRLNDGKTKLTFGKKKPVRIEADQPYEAKRILGADRSKHEYYVLDIRRENEPRLRAFIRTDDHTVRKVIQYSRGEPNKIEFVYYFAFLPRPDQGLHLPAYFAVHTAEPTDKKSRDATIKVRGRITVEINLGLQDPDLRPKK